MNRAFTSAWAALSAGRSAGMSERSIGPPKTTREFEGVTSDFDDAVGFGSAAEVGRYHGHTGMQGEVGRTGLHLIDPPARFGHDVPLGKDREHAAILERPKRSAGGGEIAAVAIDRNAVDEPAPRLEHGYS